MRKMTAAVAATMIIGGLSVSASADTPGADWLPFEQVVQKLKAAGYTLSKLEADDGRWEGEGMKDGKLMEFDADPRTGEITSERPD